MDDPNLPEALKSPTKKIIAQKEKERLKRQAEAKKAALERLRTDQNCNAAVGDVSNIFGLSGLGGGLAQHGSTQATSLPVFLAGRPR